MLGQDSVPSVLGPLAGSIAGIKSFMQGVISQKPWLIDPLSPRKAWDEDGYQLADHGNGKDLVFGIMQHDEHILPHPPVLRALEITKKALEKAGHKGNSVFLKFI
jgi:amidase